MVIKSSGMRWTGHITQMRDMRNGSKALIRKLERKRPLGRY
jgi:hypothetical protein